MTLFLIEVGYPQGIKVRDERSRVVGGGLGVNRHCTKSKLNPLGKKKMTEVVSLDKQIKLVGIY